MRRAAAVSERAVRDARCAATLDIATAHRSASTVAIVSIRSSWSSTRDSSVSGVATRATPAILPARRNDTATNRVPGSPSEPSRST